MSGTNFFTPSENVANLQIALTDGSHIVLAECQGVPPTTANKFALGAMMLQTDGTGSSVWYVNTGTVASPTWTAFGSIPPGDIPLTSAHLLVGNASNVAASVALSGDATISNAGAITVGAGKITGAKLTTGAGYFSVATLTNTTTPVNVFGSGGAPVALTVTSVVSIAQDGTASNITLKQASNTVVTIAKGTSAGGVIGGTSLANTVYAAADACTVVSSGSGNSIVVVTFTVA